MQLQIPITKYVAKTETKKMHFFIIVFSIAYNTIIFILSAI